MDIINVVSVTAQATVNHWLEENDAEIQENLYWRQALDVRTMELSVCYNAILRHFRTPALTHCLLVSPCYGSASAISQAILTRS